MTRAWCIGALALAAGSARADDLADVTDVNELSLADLLDAQIDVASKKPQTTRETPGIVTVITREEIVASGARDLLDLLVMVPGFSPGVDVEGIVDLGVRGQWAHEGKMLLLIDGQPMNELLYSTLQLGNHYPVEAIQRIEVIRGPGSAIYGGYAELAVINIITRDASDLHGVSASAHYGQVGRAIGEASFSLTFADTSKSGVSVSGALALGRGTRATGMYRDFTGGSYSMDGSSALDPTFVDVGLKYGHLRVRGIIDDYNTQTRDGAGPVVAQTAEQDFHSYYADAQYDVVLRDHLVLTPRLNVIRQTPWEITDTASELFYTKTVTRYTAGVSLSYDPVDNVNILVGTEAYEDHAHVNDPTITGFQTLFGDSRDVDYGNVAAYAQVLANHSIANLTVGARYEQHTEFGGSLVPRIALTKVMGRFHAKLLASQAFRAPGIENINLSPGGLVPERTTVFEGELGYQPTDHAFASVNVFDITIKKPIIYDYDQVSMTELYQNFDRTGTRGVEADFRLKYPRGWADVSYSFYTSAGKNTVSTYEVPGRDDVLLAFPQHKLAMSGSLNLTKSLAVNPSAVIYGQRFGYTAADAMGNPTIGREPVTAVMNVNLAYRNLFVRNLDVGAGIYDLTDQRMDYLQPYNGGHPPLPGKGREFAIRLAYQRTL
jgi:outer membrane receptor for ferrienterochelin and colicin